MNGAKYKTIPRAVAAAVLAVGLIFCSAFTSLGLSTEDIEQKAAQTGAHLASLPKAQVGSVGGEWLILGLARAGMLTEEAAGNYYRSVENYVSDIGSGKLDKRKSTENSRVILALSAIGKNAKSVAGYDLVEPLYDLLFVTKQGLNGSIWALLALDSCGYPVEPGGSVKTPATRENLIEEILSSQCPGGGWTFFGDVPDPDMTSMAIQALAPYRFFDAEVSAAIGLALSCGVYDSFDNYNAENCAQTIVALTALGIDPQADPRYSAVFDRLMRFSVENGFEHNIGAGYNQMATEQAFYAMTAYLRFRDNKTSLYDMTDALSCVVYDLDGDGAFTISDATYIQLYLAEYDVAFTAPMLRLADANRNGRVEVSDVTRLQRLLAR